MTVLGSGQQMDVVMEKFVGNTSRKEFRIIETELKKIIKMVNESYKPRTFVKLNANTLNTSDSNKTIERMFKKIFKLRKFSINWTITPNANAMTMPKSFMWLDSNYKVEKDGHRTNEKMYIGVNMFTGLIVYNGMNERELLALILHEVGHNFYTSPFMILYNIPLNATTLLNGPLLLASMIQSLVGAGIGDLLNVGENVSEFKKTINNIIHKHIPLLPSIYHTLDDIRANLTSALGISKIITYINPIKAFEVLKNGLSLNNGFRYSMEKGADTFAADYGYGLELSTALNKFERHGNHIDTTIYYKIPIISSMMDLLDLQINLITTAISGYPTHQNRIRSVLDRLKHNLNDPDLHPDVKNELEKQISSLEEFYFDDYIEISKNDNKLRIFTWINRQATEKLMGGKGDIREVFHKLDPYTYK